MPNLKVNPKLFYPKTVTQLNPKMYPTSPKVLWMPSFSWTELTHLTMALIVAADMTFISFVNIGPDSIRFSLCVAVFYGFAYPVGLVTLLELVRKSKSLGMSMEAKHDLVFFMCSLGKSLFIFSSSIVVLLFDHITFAVSMVLICIGLVRFVVYKEFISYHTSGTDTRDRLALPLPLRMRLFIALQILTTVFGVLVVVLPMILQLPQDPMRESEVFNF